MLFWGSAPVIALHYEFAVLVRDPEKPEWFWLVSQKKEAGNRRNWQMPCLCPREQPSLVKPDGSYKTIGDWKYEADQKFYENKKKEEKVYTNYFSCGNSACPDSIDLDPLFFINIEQLQKTGFLWQFSPKGGVYVKLDHDSGDFCKKKMWDKAADSRSCFYSVLSLYGDISLYVFSAMYVLLQEDRKRNING
ncbi:MAG: hypothetical protein ACLUI0_11850 [Blautia massiliensis (ex Durand et al. 2017)]